MASSDNNGSITPYGTVTVNEGESQTFYFYPNDGYSVSYITVDGETFYTNQNYCTISNLDKDISIYVGFVADEIPEPASVPNSASESGSEQEISDRQYVLAEGRYKTPALTALETISYSGEDIVDTWGDRVWIFEHYEGNKYGFSDDSYTYTIELTSDTSYRFEQRDLDDGARIFGRNYKYYD